jgi:anthranilate phosphoribosyltransferase
VRRELKMRTVFNLLGPLTNPARAQRQLIGAPSPEAASLMAEALAELGTAGAFVVHGHDGLDEISTTGPTDVWKISTGRVEKHLWVPADFGVKRAFLDDLRGGDPACNAQITRDILAGGTGSGRDIVLVNAAAGLLAAGLVGDLLAGMSEASRSIDSGAAADKLERLQKYFPFS